VLWRHACVTGLQSEVFLVRGIYHGVCSLYLHSALFPPPPPAGLSDPAPRPHLDFLKVAGSAEIVDTSKHLGGVPF